jgi:N-acyl-D-aspartate/D-glutamate deacylase
MMVISAQSVDIHDSQLRRPHPRSLGTNARLLANFVRERQIVRLEVAVRRMTSLPLTDLRAGRFIEHGANAAWSQ